MKRILLLSFAFLTVVAFSAMAQRTVSGKVTDDAGEALPGVNVVIKGTTTGTTTDLDGNYRLSVDEGATLVFSFVGFETQEVQVGARTTIDISMGGATELQEVVVTALGIPREKKALGYAVTSLDSDEVESKTQSDIGRILTGKAPGVVVTQQNGLSGSGTNIVIRGYTSISQSNQPLFVVDGIPFNSSTNNTQSFVDGQTESSRFLDIDPNSIENIQVLKGLSATVLYGEQGRNGVILITTKNGSARPGTQKTEVTVSQSIFANKIASLPDYQNSYGGGFYQNWGWFFSNWGPHFDEIDEVPHPANNWQNAGDVAAFPELQGQTVEYKPYNSVDEFFRTGMISTTSINVRGGGPNAAFNLNYGLTDDEGFTPGNSLTRNTVGFGGNVNLNNGVRVNGSVNFSNVDYQTPPVAASSGSGSFGTGSSVFGDVLYTPRSVDLFGLPFQNPVDGGSVYYRSGNDIQNPRWTVANTFSNQTVNRVWGNVGASYDITDWITANYRATLDTYTERNEYGQNKNGVDGNINGDYRTTDVTNTITSHDISFSLNRELSSTLNLTATIGINGRRDEYQRVGVQSTNQVVFDVFNHFNFVNQSNVTSNGSNIDFRSAQNWLGVYAQAALDYNNFLFLTLNGRNDWVNTLEQGNNSLFYPGASLAADLTSGIAGLQTSDIVSFLKVRVGYGSSAGFPGPYTTRNTLGLSSRAFLPNGATTPVISSAVSNRLGNPDLEPERVGEIELGVEARFVPASISVDFSVYQKNTTDLILDQQLDPSTGFTVQQVNAGELEVKGLELAVGATPLTLGDFRWEIGVNFSTYTNTVTDLPDDIDQIAFAGFTNLGNFAIEGKPYGVMLGSVAQRDSEGRRIVDATGNYIVDPEIQEIGNPIPDFLSSISNTFSYKGITLFVDVQWQQGGDMYSGTAQALLARGQTTDTDFDRRQTFVLPGVKEDGTPNNIQIAATDLYFNNLGFGPDEFSVYDATSIRLNEVSLSYRLPKSLIQNTPFGSIEVKATGFNLWYNAPNLPAGTNVDPNGLGIGVGNGLGFEFINTPSSRRYGGSIKLTF